MRLASEQLEGRDEQFVAMMESAAHLQRLVPGAVLPDLADRFEMVLEAVEGDEGWATNRVTPGKVILGNLDGIEVGVRQMIRKAPLEVTKVELLSGAEVAVPTLEETLRIKAFLIVRRNQARDYLDVAALAAVLGVDRAAEVLGQIDDYYADQADDDDGVASQLVRQLAQPTPADPSVIDQLPSYRRLRQRWRDWRSVTEILKEVAIRMVL